MDDSDEMKHDAQQQQTQENMRQQAAHTALTESRPRRLCELQCEVRQHSNT